MNAEKILTIRELSTRYGVTTATIHNLLKRGAIPCGFRVGRSRRWKLSELEAWEQSTTHEGVIKD